MPDNECAAQLLQEAYALREQVEHGSATHMGVKPDLLGKAGRAIDMTDDSELLIMAANLVQPYHRVDAGAKRLMNEARARADRLGGPSELLEMTGAAESDRHNRRVVGGGSAGGCAIAVISVMSVLVAGSLLAAPGRR